MSTSSRITPPTPTDGDLPLPFVSVIVPTRNRAETLRRSLEALLAQSFPASRCELIVVDNQSTDDTESVVLEAAAHATCPVRYIRKTNDGPAASRNRGAQEAVGEILAFTDSDCMPNRDWLLHGVAAFTEGVGVVCGPIQPTLISNNDPFFIHQILPVTHEDGLYPTANVFYRRDCFNEAGGFDETMRTYVWGQPTGGDDTELAWRVKRSGNRSAFARLASVEHLPSQVAPHEYLLNSVQAQILPRVVRWAPEVRSMAFYRRYFVHRNSALFVLFASGAVLTPRWKFSAILMVPWLKTLWPLLKVDAWPPRRWPRAGLRLVFQVLGATLLEASLVWGSIKNRRVVL